VEETADDQSPRVGIAECGRDATQLQLRTDEGQGEGESVVDVVADVAVEDHGNGLGVLGVGGRAHEEENRSGKEESHTH
jgi:hypothetical protein